MVKYIDYSLIIRSNDQTENWFVFFYEKYACVLCRASIKPTRRRFFQTSSNLSMFPVGLVSDLLVQEVMVACLGKFSFFQKGYLFIYLFHAKAFLNLFIVFCADLTSDGGRLAPIGRSIPQLIISFDLLGSSQLTTSMSIGP